MITKKRKATTSYNDDDPILCEILSRLPLKSLMRFKCVSKSWQSLIEKDQWLMGLHHRRQSQVSLRLFVVLYDRRTSSRELVNFESYYTANLFIDTNKEEEEIRATAATIQDMPNKADFRVCKPLSKLINGMICLINHNAAGNNIRMGDHTDHAVCLYDVITQDATPWVKSTYLTQVKPWCDLWKKSVFRRYEFGFDPATKEYKVICMWSIDAQGNGRIRFERCEILTLGKDTAWRRIDKIPRSLRQPIHDSVYANGSIYWRITGKDSRHVLVAFDVGSEKYRVIQDLDFVSIPKNHNPRSVELMELDGHLAIKENPGNHVVSLWILHDDCDKNSTSGNSSCNIHWTKEIVTLPLHWRFQIVLFHAVAGTEYLILQCYFGGYVYPPMLRAYNRKKKTFSKIEITGDGSPFFAIGCHPLYMFTTYTETLLTFQRSYRPATKAPHSSSIKRARRLGYNI